MNSLGDLVPIPKGASYGGVYSFVPLGEANSGAKFAIQADFLAQPGRDAINAEAAWNGWLMGAIKDLCIDVIEDFKLNERWKFQIFSIFDFEDQFSESYRLLFKPYLVEPVRKYLQTEQCVPTMTEEWVSVDNAVVIAAGKRTYKSPESDNNMREVVSCIERLEAINKFVEADLSDVHELARTFSGISGARVAHPDFRDAVKRRTKTANRRDLLINDVFLAERAEQQDAPRWFRNLYVWLYRNRLDSSRFHYYARADHFRQYHDYKFVLTSDSKVKKGGEVLLLQVESSDFDERGLIEELSKTKSLLHPSVLSEAVDEEERENIKSFLTGYAGVQVADRKRLCHEIILPKLCIKSTDSPADDNTLVRLTKYCKEVLGDDLGKVGELWVLSSEGRVRAASELCFSGNYQPKQNWETNSRFITEASFLSSKYLSNAETESSLHKWRSFFSSAGVNEAPRNGVEIFAVEFATDAFSKHWGSVKRIDSQNHGYDIEVIGPDGVTACIEVKGRSDELDIQLTPNETSAADKYQANYFLCVVAGIPNSPKLYLVKNPAATGVGEKDKLTVRAAVWKLHPWP